jgi:uncharacterized protein (DUF305 family)
MKRPVATLVGVLVVIGVTATAAVAVMTGLPDEHRFRPGMHRMMQPDDDRGLGARAGAMPGHVRVDSEVEYLVQMVAHHEEAVEAAGELARSDRPAMRELGVAIVTSQTRQIDRMRAWLARWYPGTPADTGYEPMMRDLSRLSGDALDRAFLVDMIPHHMAAVMMSQQLLVGGVATHDAVALLAAKIRDEQHAEIFTMRRWLERWFDVRGPVPGMDGRPAMGRCLAGDWLSLGGLPGPRRGDLTAAASAYAGSPPRSTQLGV